MDRDPKNRECTRDPIFLLQVGNRKWTQMPDGVETDGESMWVEDKAALDDWIEPFVEDGYINQTAAFWHRVENEIENEHGWPMVYIEWLTESVFLTRKEAEDYGISRSYRWDHWRVYCIPCDGELAKILAAYQPAEVEPELSEEPF